MPKTSILIADDHKIVRDGVRALVATVPEWEIVAEADNGRDAVALVEKLQPDVAILDLTMPGLNGLDATRQIKKRFPQVEVLIFTGTETEDLIHDVFASGARSYIVKADQTSQLLEAIRTVARHKHFFTSRIGEIVFARYTQSEKARKESAETGQLTEREREIVQLLAEGKSNKEVAATLGISVKTAETHRAAIMRKLGFKAFSELVRYAIRNKMIEP